MSEIITKNMEENEDTVKNAIYEFYKLKNTYETQIMQDKKKIMNNKLFSISEKKSEYKKLKPKCITCKRSGGTIFSIKYYEGDENNNSHREFKALCGVIADPCNLNINIKVGVYDLLPDILTNLEDAIKEIKNKIINEKNKLLFGYTSSDYAIEIFNEYKKQLEDFSSILNEYLKKYMEIVDNKEKNTVLSQDIERSYDYINQIKDTIKSYDETDNTQLIRDIINIYNEHLNPLLKKIMSSKYHENLIYYNESSNTFHLMQQKNTTKELEYTGYEDTVTAYDVVYKPTKSKTTTKTAKFIIEEEEKEEKEEKIGEEEEETVGEEEEEVENPTFNSNGTVTWKNIKTQNTWNKLSLKMRNALLTDKEWLIAFVTNCSRMRDNNKPCEFIAPDNLIVPPLLTDDVYDFGNEVYNNYFNKQVKTYQDTLLTLYSIKDGKSDYSSMINTLNNLIAKDLEFNKYV